MKTQLSQHEFDFFRHFVEEKVISFSQSERSDNVIVDINDNVALIIRDLLALEIPYYFYAENQSEAGITLDTIESLIDKLFPPEDEH